MSKCSMQTDLWTNVIKLIIAFRNFANVPNKKELCFSFSIGFFLQFTFRTMVNYDRNNTQT